MRLGPSQDPAGASKESGTLPESLHGVRVLDMTQVMAGPLSTQLLGEMGADVIKVEEPGRGDLLRRIPAASSFLSYNRNKRSITVDLRTDEGREIIYRLARVSQVAVQNFRPGVVQRYRVDYETLSQLNPSLIYASMSGFGLTGPYAGRTALDPIGQAMGGIMAITGEHDGAPVLVGASVADFSSALCLTIGILSALYWRSVTGRGQHIDTSMLDAVAFSLSGREQWALRDGVKLGRLGSAHPLHSPYQAFLCADGRWVYVAVFTDEWWESFCRVLGMEHLLLDERYKSTTSRSANRKSLVPEVASSLAGLTSDQVVRALEKVGVPCAPVLEVEEVMEDRQIIHNGMHLRMEHARLGTLHLWGCPIRMSETPPRPKCPPPMVGEHTDEVLTELGYSADEIAALRDKRVV